MNLEYLQIAFEYLFTNKTRSFLSMLGIIIGVSTVIIVVGIGLGAQQKITDQFKNLSVESIIVRAGGTGGPQRNISKLKKEDVDYVLQNTEYVRQGIAIAQGNATFAFGTVSESYGVMGIQKDFMSVSNLTLAAGRDFTSDEYLGTDRLAIIGNDIVTADFDGNAQSALGQTVSIANKDFQIVGVMAANGASSRLGSYDETVYVPFETAATKMFGNKTRLSITFLAKNIDVLQNAMDEITFLLRQNHKLKPSAPDDFSLFNAGNVITSAQDSAQTMTILLTSVAAVVLIVSGIGIMNVMFVTVVERTREIGVLKAIGAKKSSILVQFLLEAIFITMFGGLIGIGVGEAAIPLLNKIPGWYLLPSVTGMAIAFSFSVFVGIFFGFYPALRGSNLDPVDALRSE